MCGFVRFFSCLFEGIDPSLQSPWRPSEAGDGSVEESSGSAPSHPFVVVVGMVVFQDCLLLTDAVRVLFKHKVDL